VLRFSSTSALQMTEVAFDLQGLAFKQVSLLAAVTREVSFWTLPQLLRNRIASKES